MQITALDNSTSAHAGLLTRPSGDHFARLMQSAEAQAGEAPYVSELDPERAETLRTASQQLVATTFIQPMLARMREDPFKSDLFHGGQAEEVFGQQLDTLLAERIVSRADFSIVDAVYRAIADRAPNPQGMNTEVDTHA